MAIEASGGMLRKLGLELSDHDVQVLFEGHHRQAFRFDKEDRHLLLLIFSVLDRFSRKTALPETFEKDKSETWVRGILADMSKGEVIRFIGHPIFWKMIVCNPGAVATIIFDKIARKLKNSR